MSRLNFVFAFTALFALSLSAQEDFPKGPEGGKMLAEKLRMSQPAANTLWSGKLNVLGRPQKVPPIPITCETAVTGANSWSVTYTTESTGPIAAEKLKIVFSATGPSQYFYSQAAKPGAAPGEPRKLTGTEADIPLAGTDFWLSDLGLEFFHWPGQRLLPGEIRRGKSCYVLESSNPAATGNGYKVVTNYIEKVNLVLFRAVAYGTDKKTAKEFELGSAKKVNGEWQLRDMTIRTRKTGSRTRLEFDLEGK